MTGLTLECITLRSARYTSDPGWVFVVELTEPDGAGFGIWDGAGYRTALSTAAEIAAEESVPMRNLVVRGGLHAAEGARYSPLGNGDPEAESRPDKAACGPVIDLRKEGSPTDETPGSDAQTQGAVISGRPGRPTSEGTRVNGANSLPERAADAPTDAFSEPDTRGDNR